MNSKESYQLSVDYSTLEKKVLALYSKPIESTLNQPRGDFRSISHLMWLRRYGSMDTEELMRDLGLRCAPITSSDSSLRGMHAELSVHDEVQLIQEQMKMQETMKETNSTVIPWKIVLPEGANALPMKTSMHSSGDYWTPFQDLQMQGADRPHTEGPLQALWGLRVVSAWMPGFEVTIGAAMHPECLDLLSTIGPLQRVNLGNAESFYELFAPARHTLNRELLGGADNFYDGDDVVVERVVARVEDLTGYKVHKQALQLFGRIMLAPEKQLRQKYTGYDYGNYHRDFSAVALLMKLHGFVVSRFAVPLGFGFRNGEPIVMLGQPRMHKDFAAVTEYRCVEMRVGKWLANYYGNSVDFRDAIEDLKAMNVDPTTYLCKTEQEWYDAYENGPGSCMTGYGFDYSPVRVYATTSHGLPDNGLRLFIQYTGELFGDDFKVHARAIVNIETNEYVRAYGDAADAILRANGYERDTDCLDGALLARIPHPENEGAVLMPYLDGNQDGVDAEGDNAFIICDCYDYEAQDADGYIWIDDGRSPCVDCGERFDEEDMYITSDGGYVCPHCIGGDYVQVVGRDRVYPAWYCSWSDYHDSWVCDDDVAYCAVEGTVHDQEPLQCAQGYDVLSIHTETHPVHGIILTEHAASVLDEDYLGNDEVEEDKEAKAEQEAA